MGNGRLNMKKIFILLISSLVLVSGCSCSKKQEKELEKELENIVEVENDSITGEKVIDGIRFKNVSLIVKDGITEFRVTLENTVTTVKKIAHLQITFKGSNNTVIKTVDHYDFNDMKKGDTKNLSFTFSLDMSTIKEIEYKFE